MQVNKWFLILLFAVILLLSCAVAYLVGQRMVEPDITVAPSLSDKRSDLKKGAIRPKQIESIAPEKAQLEPVIAPKPKPKPFSLNLGKITNEDSRKLDMGCACGFTAGGRELMIASANTAILRPQGTRKVCSISNDQFQEIYSDEGSFSCGNLNISIRGQGSSEGMPDGHRSTARLIVKQNNETEIINGKWLCGC